MIYRLIIILIAVYSIISCTQDKKEYIENESGMSVFVTKDTINKNENLKINVVLGGRNGCTSFSRFEKTEITNGYDLKFFVKYGKNDICTTQIIDIEATIELSFSTTGNKILKYKGGDNLYKYDTLYVK